MCSKLLKSDKFSWMGSRQLGQILSSVNNFEGVYAVDTLPNRILKYPSSYLINSDLKVGPGKHWLAVYFGSDKKGFFFDSYANHPEKYGLSDFLSLNSDSWTINEMRLQSPLTSVCGAYCVYFVLMKSVGVQEWCEPFTSNLLLNDCIVSDFAERYF